MVACGAAGCGAARGAATKAVNTAPSPGSGLRVYRGFGFRVSGFGGLGFEGLGRRGCRGLAFWV